MSFFVRIYTLFWWTLGCFSIARVLHGPTWACWGLWFSGILALNIAEFYGRGVKK